MFVINALAGSTPNKFALASSLRQDIGVGIVAVVSFSSILLGVFRVFGCVFFECLVLYSCWVLTGRIYSTSVE